jgi:hypothetical protein
MLDRITCRNPDTTCSNPAKQYMVYGCDNGHLGEIALCEKHQHIVPYFLCHCGEPIMDWRTTHISNVTEKTQIEYIHRTADEYSQKQELLRRLAQPC